MAFWIRTTKISLDCNDSVQEIISKLSILFESESVAYTSQGDGISSTKTPIVFLGIDRRAYSRKNWVGINPFVFVSAIRVMHQGDSSSSDILLEVDQRRTFIIYGLVFVNMLVVSLAAPLSIFPFFAVFTLIALSAIWYFSNRLIRSEIELALNSVRRK